jgi:hypothetical protein
MLSAVKTAPPEVGVYLSVEYAGQAPNTRLGPDSRPQGMDWNVISMGRARGEQGEASPPDDPLLSPC